MALDLNDKTANGNTLTNNNGATEITASLPFAQSSKAAQLALASSQYFSAVDSASLSPTGNLTIEMWVKFTSLPIDNGAIMAFCTKGVPNNYSWLFGSLQASSAIYLYAEISSNGSTSDGILQAWTPSTGVWYHIALVFTAATSKYQFFVDGVQVGADQNGTRTSIFNSAEALLLGAYNAAVPARFLNGQIDEVRVWNTARTVTQLANNKSIELVGNESGLAAYWPLEATLGAGSSGFFAML